MEKCFLANLGSEMREFQDLQMHRNRRRNFTGKKGFLELGPMEGWAEAVRVVNCRKRVKVAVMLGLSLFLPSLTKPSLKVSVAL
jgi:hypothetical protein